MERLHRRIRAERRDRQHNFPTVGVAGLFHKFLPHIFTALDSPVTIAGSYCGFFRYRRRRRTVFLVFFSLFVFVPGKARLCSRLPSPVFPLILSHMDGFNRTGTSWISMRRFWKIVKRKSVPSVPIAPVAE